MWVHQIGVVKELESYTCLHQKFVIHTSCLALSAGSTIEKDGDHKETKEEKAERKAREAAQYDPKRFANRFKRRRRINWIGSIVFFLYICAFLAYMFIRITKTLQLGSYLVYGLFVLFVEILGASTTFIYGAATFRPSDEPPYTVIDTFNTGMSVLNVCALPGFWLLLGFVFVNVTRPASSRVQTCGFGNQSTIQTLTRQFHRRAGTNLIFTPVNPELDRLKVRKGKDAQLPVSDSASVKSINDGDVSVAGDLEEGGVGKVRARV